jgi:tRNA (mo5U34)-methyltransferase
MRTTAPEGFDLKRFAEGIHWHQGWDIFPGQRTPGRSPVEVAMNLTGVPSDLSGKRVLDIGAWNGCTSFECERRGAREVVALTLESPDDGFNQLKAVLQSTRSHFVRGTIYDLDPRTLQTFDIVLCFGVIYHLRYPVLGIDNLRRITRGTLHIETHLLDNCLVEPGQKAPVSLSKIDKRLSEASLMQFYPGKELYGDGSNWFSPSMSALVGLISTAGFSVETTTIRADRGFLRARSAAGRPRFLQFDSDFATYEGSLYRDSGLERLFGPIELWD